MSFTLWWKPPLLGTDLSCSPARPARVGTLLETRRHCFPDIILQLKSEASNLWPIARRESTTVLISVTRTPSWYVHREDRAPDAPRSWYGSSSPLRQTRGDLGPSKWSWRKFRVRGPIQTTWTASECRSKTVTFWNSPRRSIPIVSTTVRIQRAEPILHFPSRMSVLPLFCLCCVVREPELLEWVSEGGFKLAVFPGCALHEHLE